jgi:hypothetical protein
MLTPSARLAMAATSLWLTFGIANRVEASGMALSTPAGFSPGAPFGFVFLTDGATGSSSTKIADYNNFVNSQAGGETYDGSVIT